MRNRESEEISRTDKKPGLGIDKFGQHINIAESSLDVETTQDITIKEENSNWQSKAMLFNRERVDKSHIHRNKSMI